MKLVFLTVSLIAAFTVDSQPEPYSLHSDIAEELQWPDSEDNDSEDTTSMPTLPHVVPDMDLGPDDSEDDDPEQRNLWTEPTPLMPDFTPGDDDFDIEEEEEPSENELRGSGCKAKLACSMDGGHCVSSSAYCYGRRVPGGCKGSCDCCIPVCPYEDGYFSPPGSRQCFMFYKTRANWTSAEEICNGTNPPLQLAHPDDAVSLRSYMIQKFGSGYYFWLNARGTGSYFRWQPNGPIIQNNSPLWWNGRPYNTSSNYCLLFLTNTYDWRKNPTNQTYYPYPCRYATYPLCELILDQ